MRQRSDSVMKRFLIALALTCLPVTIVTAQDIYEDMSHDYIPQYFMDGAFFYPGTLESLVEDLIEVDPLKSSILDTYCQLSNMMMGLKVERSKVEANMLRIEKYMGTDNTIYALAMLPKAVEDDENLNVLLQAAELIAGTAGDESWEYALAMFLASSFTLDIEKYGDSSQALEYSEKCMEILEGGDKDTWLYYLAMVNKGIARIFAQDGEGINDMIAAHDAFGDEIDEKECCPYIYAALNLATIYTSAGYHDLAIELAQLTELFLLELELTSSDMYMSLNRTLCYAYAMKKERKKARSYFAKAEQACIERFGEGSKQHKSLDRYREML